MEQSNTQNSLEKLPALIDIDTTTGQYLESEKYFRKPTLSGMSSSNFPLKAWRSMQKKREKDLKGQKW